MLKRSTPQDIEDRHVNHGGSFQPWSAIKDVFAGLMLWRIWSALSWYEFQSTYRRSGLGVTWVIMSFAGFVFIKITIFSSLLSIGEPGYYDTYLVLGFYVWFYISQSVASAPDTFIANQSWIRSEPLPLSTYVYKSVLREFYGLALTSFAVIAGVLYIGYPIMSQSLGYSALAIGFLLISACVAKLFLGTIAARYRDVGHLVKAIMLPMMFLTPIFWMPSQMESLMPYLWWNPFYHYLEIFRAPLMDGAFPTKSWIFVGSFTGGIALLAMLLYSSSRQRMVFWI